MSVQVLLIDDNPIFTRSTTRFLDRLPEVQVVGVAERGKQGLDLAQDLEPDIILLDLNMPDVHGLDLLPHLRERLPDTRVIILTLHESWFMREQALARGAYAFVSKSRLLSDLEPAIECAAGLGSFPLGAPTEPH